MQTYRRIVCVIVLLIFPSLVFGETIECVNSYNGYQKKRYELPPSTLNPGPNQHNSLSDNVGAARQDINKSYFTTELTSFNDKDCGGIPCRNDIPGIAHRTWPKGSCVAVCRASGGSKGPCAITIVMDKGPNTRLGCRTIDANPALQAVLGMNGGTVQAIYQLLSLPPETCKTSATPPNFSVPPASVSNDTNLTPMYSGNPSNPYSPVGVSPFSALGASPSGGAFGAQGATAGYGTMPAQGSPLNIGTSPQGTSASVSGDGIVSGSTSRSAATIFVQPSNVKVGDSILISWTSVNMKPSSCKVTKNEEEFASGNEATKRDIATQGAATYTLECTTASGDTVKASSSVSIQ